ncbi:P-loop containing nucleoside triphosphate hydrolase protein [Flammula alnicola]|nr:P-loop containing nucleoside triphosphate hydrolase protein [Flammula alnicola]
MRDICRPADAFQDIAFRVLSTWTQILFYHPFETSNNTMSNFSKNLRAMVKHDDPILKDGNANDIVIPIMGPTGVGKSSFINTLLGDARVTVGHSLKSCTPHLQPVIITTEVPPALRNQLKGRRLIIVDTPGFDDTFVDDSEILRRISVWLAASYSKKMKLGGVIYLHDISQTRMLGTTRRNLDMFQKLVGKDALRSIVLGTTKWSLVQPETASKREGELKSAYWKEMIKAGSPVFQVDTSESSKRAWDLIAYILREIEKQRGIDRFLKIQDELVNMRRIIPETDAGKTLKYTLDQLIDMQKQRAQKLRAQLEKGDDEELHKQFVEGEKQLGQLVQMAKEMKIPLSRRIKKFFGLVSFHRSHPQILRGYLIRMNSTGVVSRDIYSGSEDPFRHQFMYRFPLYTCMAEFRLAELEFQRSGEF